MVGLIFTFGLRAFGATTSRTHAPRAREVKQLLAKGVVAPGLPPLPHRRPKHCNPFAMIPLLYFGIMFETAAEGAPDYLCRSRGRRQRHDRRFPPRCVCLRREEFPPLLCILIAVLVGYAIRARRHQSASVHRRDRLTDDFGSGPKARGRLTHGHLHYCDGLCFLRILRVLPDFPDAHRSDV